MFQVTCAGDWPSVFREGTTINVPAMATMSAGLSRCLGNERPDRIADVSRSRILLRGPQHVCSELYDLTSAGRNTFVLARRGQAIASNGQQCIPSLHTGVDLPMVANRCCAVHVAIIGSMQDVFFVSHGAI